MRIRNLRGVGSEDSNLDESQDDKDESESGEGDGAMDVDKEGQEKEQIHKYVKEEKNIEIDKEDEGSLVKIGDADRGHLPLIEYKSAPQPMDLALAEDRLLLSQDPMPAKDRSLQPPNLKAVEERL